MMQIEWEVKLFKQLNADELYDILKLRVNVFVVEQNCPYPELDEKDRHLDALHLIGRSKDGQIAAYLRILPPGLSFKQVSVGRLVVAETFRGHGLSEIMMQKAFEQIRHNWPNEDIKIGAQVYLKDFYKSLGFKESSKSYLEDGIPHIDMIKRG